MTRKIGLGLAKPNRNNRQNNISRGYWCMSCDQALIKPGQKCPACGARSGKYRNKKDTLIM